VCRKPALMIKVFLRPLLFFLLAYVLLFLLISLPVSKKATSSFYLQMANTFIPPVLPKAYLEFEQDPANPNDPDRVRVRMQSKETVAAGKQAAKEQGLKTIDLQ